MPEEVHYTTDMSEAPRDFRKSTPYLGVSLEPLTTSDLVPSDSLASLPVLLWVSLVRLLDKLLLVLGEPLAREGLKHQVFNLVPIDHSTTAASRILVEDIPRC